MVGRFQEEKAGFGVAGEECCVTVRGDGGPVDVFEKGVAETGGTGQAGDLAEGARRLVEDEAADGSGHLDLLGHGRQGEADDGDG